jgi:hypothetical protein
MTHYSRDGDLGVQYYPSISLRRIRLSALQCFKKKKDASIHIIMYENGNMSMVTYF